jgi:Autographiviridae endonuclease VII
MGFCVPNRLSKSNLRKQTCRKCCAEKPIEAFEFRNDSGKYRTDCSPCRANHEAARRYGVTVGTIDALREQQGNRCAICRVHADEVPHVSFRHNPLVIDHDHAAGEVRGLLCSTCNIGLGQFKDSVDLLQKAIAYLTKQ